MGLRRFFRRSSTGSLRPWWRTVVYTLLPLLVFVCLLEGILRLAGVGDAQPQAPILHAPGFEKAAYVWPRDHAIGPWFYVSMNGNVRVNEVLLQRSMHQLHFPLAKKDRELRLFALGGSTTQGEPYLSRERGFPERLQRMLQTRAPRWRWRVHNTGVGGMDSNAFPDLVREILSLSPDGLLLYAGNNELRGRLIQVCTDLEGGEHRPLGDGLAIVRFGRILLGHIRGPSEFEVRVVLDEQQNCMKQAVMDMREELKQRGLGGDNAAPEGDEPWLPAWPDRVDSIYLDTVRQFEENIAQVLDLARESGIPVWLAIPPINYQSPPDLSLFRADLTDVRLVALERWLSEAKQSAVDGRRTSEERVLDQILNEDPSHAEACFMRGMLALSAGDRERAHALLRRAVDRDFAGRRITSHMQGALRGLCHDRPELRCVDVQAAFESHAEDSLPGDELLVDFCHPTFEVGVQLIAETFAESVLAWEAELPLEE